MKELARKKERRQRGKERERERVREEHGLGSAMWDIRYVF